MARKRRRAPVFRLATDCSGLDTPVWAFQQTSHYINGDIYLDHVFSSETDPTARAFIEANHSPKQLFGDCWARNPAEIDADEIDCLVAGFPCQPFSPLGLREGFKDDRTKPYKGVIKTLRARRPVVRSVLLENVASLESHDGGRSMARVLADLQKCGYMVTWRKYYASDC